MRICSRPSRSAAVRATFRIFPYIRTEIPRLKKICSMNSLSSLLSGQNRRICPPPISPLHRMESPLKRSLWMARASTERPKGALEAGGKTFAVLGCGADRCYPRENYGLFHKMETQGGVLSEFVPGTSPLPMNFPMRNRIISGLSDAVILVEAREKSGSLITADLALEQGKEVFAVPGRITDPLSRGCNRLIQNGAAVCLGPEDVLEAFGIKFEKKTRADKKTEKRLAKNENMVYSFLDSRSGTLEEIMDACGLSVTETMECLLKLELMGMVQGNGDQYYCRKL